MTLNLLLLPSSLALILWKAGVRDQWCTLQGPQYRDLCRQQFNERWRRRVPFPTAPKLIIGAYSLIFSVALSLPIQCTLLSSQTHSTYQIAEFAEVARNVQKYIVPIPSLCPFLSNTRARRHKAHWLEGGWKMTGEIKEIFIELVFLQTSTLTTSHQISWYVGL